MIDVGDQRNPVARGHRHAPFDADRVFSGPGAQHPGQQHRRKLIRHKTGDAQHDQQPGDRLENARTHRVQRSGGRGRESAVVEAEHQDESGEHPVKEDRD